MHNTPIAETSLRVQLREKNSGDPVPNQQLIPKKLPQSQKPLNANLDRPSDTLDNIRFLRLAEVKLITGLSKTSLYALIRERSFPPPVHLGPRAVAWVRSEVSQWAVDRVNASRSAA